MLSPSGVVFLLREPFCEGFDDAVDALFVFIAQCLLLVPGVCRNQQNHFRTDGVEEQDRLRPGAQRGDTAATCDARVEDDITQPRNVPTLLSGGGELGGYYFRYGKAQTHQAGESRQKTEKADVHDRLHSWKAKVRSPPAND